MLVYGWRALLILFPCPCVYLSNDSLCALKILVHGLRDCNPDHVPIHVPCHNYDFLHRNSTLSYHEQYLGFGLPAGKCEGRRAITNADLKSFSDSDDAISEIKEKDALLIKVSICSWCLLRLLL